MTTADDSAGAWVSYTTPDGSVSARFPADPADDSAKLEGRGGLRNVVAVDAVDGDVDYLLVVGSWPRAVDDAGMKLVAGLLAGRGPAQDITDSHPTTFDGRQAVAYTSNKPNGTAEGLVVSAGGNRLVLIMTGAVGGGHPDLERFAATVTIR